MYQGMGKRRLGDGSQKASRLPRDFDELFPSFILNLLLLHGPAFGNGTQVCTISIRFVLFFSHSVMSDSLPPCGLHHCRIPCPSLSPGVCSNSCPLSQGCHPTISSSVTPFSSFPQSFPASGSFPMSRLFAYRYLMKHYSFIWLCWVFVAVPGAGCPQAWGILVPWSGIKPVSPALEGRSLTSGPPGKSQ